MKRLLLLIAFGLASTSAFAGIIGETVKGTTDYSVELKIIDSTDGTPETSVTAATGGLNFWYRRQGAAVTNFTTEADLSALTDAHAGESFLHIADGIYRVDLVDAAVASGADYVYVGGTATGMIVIGGRIQLTDVDRFDPATDTVANVTTVATLTGHTAQTGDNYARLGAPAGASVSADIAALPTAAEVNAEVDTALTDIHLDHLLAADYDPATQPGVATALLNELIESDAGVSRFTVNALENGPSGSGASAATIADAVWDELQADHVTAGSFGIIASEVADILVDTAAIPSFPTNFADLDIEVTTGHVDVGYWNGTEITTALETSATIADAVWDELQADHVAAGSFGVTASEIASILVDTAEIGTAGAGLTNIDLPNQTMDITGNLSGSIGSVGTGGITATSIAADAIGSSELAATAVTEIQSGLATSSALATVDENVDILRRAVAQHDTTIATLASQVSFTLTDGSADDDAYNACGIMITDQATATQIAMAGVQDYVGASRTVTLDADPAIFTMATSDLVTISCQAVSTEFMNKSEILGTGTTGDLWTGN